MLTFDVTFFGTGTSQGIPVIGCTCEVCTSANPRDQRLRSSIGVEVNDKQIVIDCGPDFRQQLLRSNFTRVEHILLTHEHMDHISGIDDVRALNFTLNKPMKIYATSRVQSRLKEQFAYAFSEQKYPGAPEIELRSLSDEPFEIGGVPIIPLPVLHGGWPVMGFRIGDFAYITDAKSIPDTTLKLLNGVKVLVLNALRMTPHHSHFTLDEAVQVAEQVGVDILYLTHISHQLGKHENIMPILPHWAKPAYDGLQIRISSEGCTVLC